MRNDLMGLVFSHAGDHLLRDLTEVRCLGSVPFGGRYRLIDFTLSNLVNAGVSKVGIITKSNYHSLMDHLGSGKPWDLARKKGGITVFPPYINGSFGTQVDDLFSLLPYLEMSKEEYIVLAQSDCVSNFDLEDMMRFHIARGADITAACTRGRLPCSPENDRPVFRIAPDGRVEQVLLSPKISGDCDFSIHVYVLKKTLLIALIREAASRGASSLTRDIIVPCTKNYRLYSYRIDGFVKVIDSLQSYFEANMALLDRPVRDSLFRAPRPVYTKIRDEMPARYGLGSSVSACLIADGCVIEGQLSRCILFRGVHIGKDARLSDCIIMQGSSIGKNAELSYIISDKNVQVADAQVLRAYPGSPAVIKKGERVP